jgi:hypothetical protein
MYIQLAYHIRRYVLSNIPGQPFLVTPNSLHTHLNKIVTRHPCCECRETMLHGFNLSFNTLT